MIVIAQSDTSALLWDQAAYDRLAYKPLREELFYDRFASVKPTRQSMPGSSVIFDIKNELAAAVTPLTEGTDVTPVAMSDAQVTVTLVEYGNATETTAKLRGTSYIEVDPEAAETIGFNAGLSIDTVVQAIMSAGTNVLRPGVIASRVTTAATSIITASLVRQAWVKLRNASVRGFGGADVGAMYASIINPSIAYDLRQETGAGAWRVPREYVDPRDIWNGEMGTFEGFRFINTPRAINFADSGVGGTVDVYATLFFGHQALAKAWSSSESSEFPQVRIGPQVDRLRRFHPIGWYWLGGYSIFRQAALWRLEAASSIGAN